MSATATSPRGARWRGRIAVRSRHECERLEAPVVPVLAGDRGERLPRPIHRPDGRVEDDASAGAAKARAELEVLVPDEALVPAAVRTKDVCRPGSEEEPVHVDARIAGQGRAPEAGVPDAERRRERGCQSATPGPSALDLVPAADARRIRFLFQRAEAGRDVSRRHFGVPVEAHDHLAVCRGEGGVQAGGGDPLRVVHDEGPRGAREARGGVRRSPVGDDDLQALPRCPARGSSGRRRRWSRASFRAGTITDTRGGAAVMPLRAPASIGRGPTSSTSGSPAGAPRSAPRSGRGRRSGEIGA